MKLYKNYRPTQFDHNIHIDDREDWYVAPCGVNRDSGILTLSNWEAQKAVFQSDIDNGMAEVHNFGHWGCGWFSILLIHPSLADKGHTLEDSIDSYPILDEDDFSIKQDEAMYDLWINGYTLSERVDMCREEGISIFAARHVQIPDKLYNRLYDSIEIF